MTEEARLREQVSTLAKSMFDRGLTHGSTGTMSVRTGEGGRLVSPTGTSFGRLDPGRLNMANEAKMVNTIGSAVKQYDTPVEAIGRGDVYVPMLSDHVAALSGVDMAEVVLRGAS